MVDGGMGGAKGTIDGNQGLSYEVGVVTSSLV